MKLLMEQLASANLAWVHDVFVRSGEIKDPGITKFFKLIVAPRNPAIKPSRVEDTVLQIVVEDADQDALDAIKNALLENPSLKQAHERIKSAVWYEAAMTIS